MANERAARPRAPRFIDPPGYARHRPEETLLYQIVERHYPELVATREAADRQKARLYELAAVWKVRGSRDRPLIACWFVS
jgi:hypothetical protein